MRLRASIEVPKEAKARKSDIRPKDEPVRELLLDNIPVLVSPWSRKYGEWWKTKIGQIPRSLQRPDRIATLFQRPSDMPMLVNNSQHALPQLHQQPVSPRSSAPTLSDGHVSAESLAVGRRLSSFPPPAPAASPSAITSRVSQVQPSRSISPPSPPMQLSPDPAPWPILHTSSDSGHDYRAGTQYLADGKTNRPNGSIVPFMPMNGAYPVMPKSISQPQLQSPSRIMLDQSNMNPRKGSDVSDSQAASRSPLPASPLQDLETSNAGDEQSRRLSLPAISSLPMSIARKRDSNKPITAFGLDRQKATSDIGHAEYLRRKGTLSTISGSPPESPASSPGTESANSVPLPQKEWLTTDQEKEAFLKEARESAHLMQNRLGELPLTNGHRNVEGRVKTPLLLSRTISNLSPVRSISADYISLDAAVAGSGNDELYGQSSAAQQNLAIHSSK